MKAYELLYFVDPAATEEARAGVMKRIDVAITGEGGTVDNIDDWGKRKLAFEVDGLTEGDYTLIDFHARPHADQGARPRPAHQRRRQAPHESCAARTKE